MIRVLFSGGLGNQLFEYATGRMLSLKHQTGLTLDLTFLHSKLQVDRLATFRRYELGDFNLPVEIADLYIKGKFLYPVAKTEYLCRKLIATKRYQHIKEDDSGWDQRIMHAPDNVFLEGYFQSEKYFAPEADIIRKDLEFKKPLSGKNAELSAQITSSNSVSLHIRRGDYVWLNSNLQKHGITSPEYYDNAIAFIRERVSNPKFFVFSDEPGWARSNFGEQIDFVIADSNQTPDTAWIDMHLMSQCRHHIICNSTFSWWGAWLDPRPEKLVIAPRRWFADASLNASHILPDSWIKL